MGLRYVDLAWLGMGLMGGQRGVNVTTTTATDHNSRIELCQSASHSSMMSLASVVCFTELKLTMMARRYGGIGRYQPGGVWGVIPNPDLAEGCSISMTPHPNGAKLDGSWQWQNQVRNPKSKVRLCR